VILAVPMALVGTVGALVGLGIANNLYTQIGLILLIALSRKNAILIVEFARQLEDRGRSRWDAAVEATRLRLRPILMTSFAFILGVTPLVWAVGAGAELRQALGTAVFFGMIGVTAFGLIFTPVFYVIARWIAQLGPRRGQKPASGTQAAE
jgi:multidrug efflux pump subunit AcrB